MKRLFFFLLTLFAFIGSACSPSIISTQTEPVSPEPVIPTQQVVTGEPTALPVPTETPFPVLPFEATTYRDEVAGFEFDHPAGWAFDDGEVQSRGSYVQFYSWDWNPGDPIDPLPVGETILSVTNQLWDPKNDLEAFINQRKLAWDSSGISILSEERLPLAGDRPAVQFIVQGVDGAQAYFLFTTAGEQYLVLSGSGDLNLLAQIAHTLRPIW
jgi:hypothetical protein